MMDFTSKHLDKTASTKLGYPYPIQQNLVILILFTQWLRCPYPFIDCFYIHLSYTDDEYIEYQDSAKTCRCKHSNVSVRSRPRNP